MFIGIDMGGTKIAALVLNGDGRELARLRLPTPTSYEDTLKALAKLVIELENEVGAAGLPVGLGLPGVVDAVAGTVQALNLPWLSGCNLAADLATRLKRTVAIANDGNCFALSEAVDGAGAGARTVFGAVLGTGVGGGLVVDGNCLNGCHGITGEWGHTPLPWREPKDGPPVQCLCGRMGCIETILCGTGLINIHRRLGGTAACAAEVGLKAASGDDIATQALELYFSALARALSVVLNLLDPDAIVLGGGLSDLPDISNSVQRLWCGLSLAGQPRTRLSKARHGADSGVRGAAWLARQRT
ncbi:MAG: ROK family protein [Rhodospirillaceae bacterium]